MNNIAAEQAQMYITEAIHDVYRRLKVGKDVAPSQQFYLQGQAAMLMEFDVITFDWLKHQVNKLYQEYFSEHVEQDLWLWMENQQHFILPMKMWEAPVYKN